MKRSILIGFACVLLSSVNLTLQAQDRTVTGKVTSAEDGTAIPGVNIVIKGTTVGTATDIKGQYSLAVPESATLVFSFIGLTTEEIAVGNRYIIDVAMRSDIKSLSEVVVTALGIESQKRALGTSVTELAASKIENTRQTNVVNAFSGKVAGVRVQGSNGMVGASSAIFIRGFTTFTGSNQPLFVVDGIPIDNGGGANNLQSGVSNSNRAIDLNPDDIETMTVLKGPAAAVLYGSRAAAGAIIITTKKGKENKKATVDFTSNYNVVEVNKLPDFQNTYGQGSNGLYNPASLDSWGPKIEGQEVINYLGEKETLKAYPNNLKDFFKKGYNFQNSLSFSGGNDKSTYIFSYSNLQEEGIIKNNKLVRNTFKIAATTKLTSKLSAGASATYFNTVSQRTPIGNQQSNPLFRAYFLPRSYNLQGYPYKNTDGSQTYYDTAVDNPYWTVENNMYKDRLDRILANADFKYTFTDWLSASYKIGTDAYILNINAIDAIGTKGNLYSSSSRKGGVFDGNFFNQQTSSYLNITATKNITENIGLSAIVGNEVSVNYTRDQYVSGVEASAPGFGQITSTASYTPYSDITKSRLIGIYGQLEGSFKDYLFLTLTGRNDWSSTFAKGKRSFFYPSAATSFVFSDAIPVFKGSPILTYGKIRANIAQVGRQATAYSTDTYFAKANPSNGYGPNLQFPFRSAQAYSLSNTAGNPDLGPEFTTTREVGTELRFLNNRISLDVAYFNTKSTDIIVNAPLSAASSFTSITRNAGELKSEGWEVALGWTPIKTSEGFTWNIDANWTRIRTTVLKIDPFVSSIFLGGFTSPQTQLQANQPYGVIVGNPLNRDENGNLLITATGTSAGQVTTNSNKVDVIGNPNPDWTGGLTNTFSYKGLSLSFLLDFRKGGDIISRNIRDVRFRGVVKETGDRERTYIIPGVLRDPNNNADGTPKALLNADGQPVPNNIEISAQQYWTSLYNTQGEAIVFDASWIRLRELSVSYSLPKSLLEKTPFGRLELTATGRNLFLYAPNYPHFDPEVNSQGASNSQGFEFNTLPQTRTYGILLRATF